MPKTWKEVKSEIEAETERIWLREPEEITQCRNGEFPSGLGSYGQYFSNLVFLEGDQRCTYKGGSTVIKSIMDPSFTLDACKKLFEWITLFNTGFLSCINLEKQHKFARDIIDSYDTIKTKEELKELVTAFFIYAHRMYFWAFNAFPWSLGFAFLRKEPKDLAAETFFMIKEKGST